MQNARAYTLLFAANAISGFAQGISMLAIPWYFSEQLHQPERFGLLYALTTLIMLFWGLLAGSLIDRYSRKSVFIGIHIFGLLLLGSVSAWGFIKGDVGAWGAMAVFSGTILVYNIHYPALYAFGQEITEKHYYHRFTSWTEVVGQSTSILSGAIAAALMSGFAGNSWLPSIAPWSLHEIFLADALTYLLGLLLILQIRYTPMAERKAETGNVFQRIQSGIAFLKQHRLIFRFGNASFAIFIVLLITVQQLLPLYVSQHLNEGAGTYAMAELCYALGAMLAGFGIVRLFRKPGLVKGVLILMGCTVLIYSIAAFSRHAGLYLFLSVLLGLTNAGTRVLRTTWLFQHVPNQTIGRVSSVFQTLNILYRAVLSGLFALPFFNRDGHIVFAYALCAVVVAGFMVPILLRYRQLRTMAQP